MLQEMRKYSKSTFANILLGVLALSFVSWGVGDMFFGRTDTSVARVGGVAIDQETFSREYRNALRGQNISGEEAKKLNLGNQLLEQMISRQTLDNVVQDLGLTASDAMVNTAIYRFPQFSGLTGQFDRNVFRQTIDRIGYSEQGFIELMRGDMARTQLVNAIEGGFTMPAGYARAMISYVFEVRAADYMVVDSKAIGPVPTPTDAQLQAFVKAHPESFSSPEYRDVSFAWISPSDVAGTIKIGDDQVKKAYDEHLDLYVIPEKRDLQFLVFQTEANAKAARDKASAGTPFDQISNEKGEKATALPDMTADGLADADIGKAVFATPKGGVTQPLKMVAGGWALYRVVDSKPGSTKTFDQVKEDIRKLFVNDQAQSKISDISNLYTDASSAGATMEESAKKAGMHFARVPAVDANGLAPDGSKAPIPDDPDFRNQMVHAEVGEEGDPQPAKSGLLYVVSVNGVTPPKLKSLDQVRPQAIAGWTEQQRRLMIQKKASELAAQSNREGTLQNVARTIGATVQSSPALIRRTNNDAFSQQLLTLLFKAKPGETVFGPKGTNGDYLVARVTGILHPPIPETNPNYKAAVASISQGVASGITEAYIAEQRDVQSVKYNTKLMNSVVGSES